LRRRDLHLEARAVRLHAGQLVPRGRAAGRSGGENRGQRLARFLGGQVEDDAAGPVFVPGPPEDLHGRRVGEGDRPVGLGDDPFSGLLEERLEAGVALGDVPVVANVDLHQGLVAGVPVGQVAPVLLAQPPPRGDGGHAQESAEGEDDRELERRHARRSPAPQCRPAPSAVKPTRSPSRIFPRLFASWKTSGRVAAVVLPYRWMLLTTFSSGSPRFFCTASLMRRLAWCMSRSETSESSIPCFASVSRTICGIAVVASRKTC